MKEVCCKFILHTTRHEQSVRVLLFWIKEVGTDVIMTWRGKQFGGFMDIHGYVVLRKMFFSPIILH